MKLSAHDCDMLRSFVHTGDVAGLISFVEGLDGKTDVPAEKEPVKQDVRRTGKEKVSDT